MRVRKNLFLACLLKFEMPVVRELLSREDIPPAPSNSPAIATGETTADLLDACCRLVGLLDKPRRSAGSADFVAWTYMCVGFIGAGHFAVFTKANVYQHHGLSESLEIGDERVQLIAGQV